ncbi:hypothetical protein CEE74_14280, partial [Lactobacillus crispatus]
EGVCRRRGIEALEIGFCEGDGLWREWGIFGRGGKRDNAVGGAAGFLPKRAGARPGLVAHHPPRNPPIVPLHDGLVADNSDARHDDAGFGGFDLLEDRREVAGIGCDLDRIQNLQADRRQARLQKLIVALGPGRILGE